MNKNFPEADKRKELLKKRIIKLEISKRYKKKKRKNTLKQFKNSQQQVIKW